MGGAIEDIKRIMNDEIKLPSNMRYQFVGQAENFQELMTNVLACLRDLGLCSFILFSHLFMNLLLLHSPSCSFFPWPCVGPSMHWSNGCLS